MAAKKDRPPIPGGYPDTKIDGPAVERTGLAPVEPEDEPEAVPEATDDTPAEPEA
jgi:hypothetical protein